MGHELIFKKLDQITEILNEWERLLRVPLEEFVRDLTAVRAAERNFQLAVDLASDINTQILIGRGDKTPDTCRESFTALEKAGVLPHDLTRRLIESAKVRNILVHEYDFEDDYEKFYHAAGAGIPAYREYGKTIYEHIRSAKGI